MTSNKFFTTSMVGPECSPRYVIRDKRQSERVLWNGLRWTRNPNRAMIFADMAVVWEVIYTLTVALFTKRFKPKHFRFYVDVTVFGNVSQEEVESYLTEAMKIRLNYDDHGTGPHDESLILFDIPGQELVPVS
jgi:hypothetical protein